MRQILLFFLLLFLLRCSSNDLSSGSGSEVTNGFMIAFVNEQGTPITNASITVRPIEWTAPPNFKSTNNDSMRNILSSKEGEVTVQNMKPGEYRVFAISPDSSLVGRQEVILSRGMQELSPLMLLEGTTVKASIDKNSLGDSVDVYFQLPGTDLSAPLKADGVASLSLVPQGVYYFQFTPTTPLITPLKTDTIMVVANDTLTLKTAHFELDSISSFKEWPYSKKMVVDTQKLLPENNILPIRITEEIIPKSQRSLTGADIRITSAEGEELPFHIIQWKTNPTLSVQISSSTKELMLYWGKNDLLSHSNHKQVYNPLYSAWGLESEGDTVQIDYCSTANNATIFGQSKTTFPVSTEAIIGKGLTFDGVDDYIQFPPSEKLEFGNQFTVSFWANITTIDSVNGRFFSKEKDWEIKENHGKLQCSGGGAYILSEDTLPQGEWFLATISIDRSKSTPVVTLYLNGKEMTIAEDTYKTNFSATQLQQGNPLYIGALGTYEGTESHLTGSLDEIYINPTILTAQEVLSRYLLESPNSSIIK